MAIAVRRLGKTFFAEIEGLDVARDLDDPAAWRTFHEAYLAYQVIALHDQALTPPQFLAFGGRFGPVEPHTVEMYHHPDAAGITVLSNRVEMGRPKGIRDAGSEWHSDYSYKKVTANATILYALEIPDEGGDTWFADLAAAFDALSDTMKARLEGMQVRQQYRWSRDRDHPEGRWRLLSDRERAKTPEIVHPLVRTHPETGRKGLFVFPAVSSGVIGILGMDRAESDALIAEIFAHMRDPRFHVRYRWKRGDLVVWDNRTLMHKATTDVLSPERYRTLYRINTTGSVPY